MNGQDNIVYVGSKPVMTYVMAVLSSFNENPERVILKARGRAIPIAVDAAEVTKNSYIKDLTCDVTIGTEELSGEDGRPRNVSTIEITMKKSPEAKEPKGREPTTEAERLPESEQKK